MSEGGSLLKASLVMAIGTLLSRLLGFVRNAMLLIAIGAAAGGVNAAFQTANTLPNMVYNLLASGVINAILIPQIVSAFKRKSGQEYVNRLLTLAGTILFVVTVIMMVAAPLLVLVTAFGYSQEIRVLAIAFALLCLPQIFFYGLYNLLGQLLNARGVYGPYMWAPVVNNVVAIIGLAVFLWMWGQTPGQFAVTDFSSAQFWVLGGSATLGVIAQALILFIPMKRAGITFRPDFHFRGNSFGRASHVAGWTFATLGLNQIGVLATTNISSFADEWAHSSGATIAGISARATAYLLWMLPHSLITLSVTTVIFTRIAEAVADGNTRRVADNYLLGVRTVITTAVLSSAILIATAVPLMQAVLPLQTDTDLIRAYAWVLVAFAPSLPALGIMIVVQTVFYAYEDAKPLFLLTIPSTTAMLIACFSLFYLLTPPWWVVATGIGESVALIVFATLGMRQVSRKVPLVQHRPLLRNALSSFTSASIACAAGIGALSLIGVDTVTDSSMLRPLIALAKVIAVAIIIVLIHIVAMRILAPQDLAKIMHPIGAKLRIPVRIRTLLFSALPTHTPPQTSETPTDDNAVSSLTGVEENSTTQSVTAGSIMDESENVESAEGEGNDMSSEEDVEQVTKPEPASTSKSGTTSTSDAVPASTSTALVTTKKPASTKLGFDPTVPTLAFAGILIAVAFFWAVAGLFTSPNVKLPELSITQSSAKVAPQTPQSVAVTAENTPKPATPEIAQVSVLSWNGSGDNEDQAINIMDGDDTTSWESRAFDINQFPRNGTVTLLFALKQEAPVKEISLIMDNSTSGGEAVLRSVNPENPREGTDLKSVSMSPLTTITLDSPTPVRALAVSFRTMPQTEGLFRARVLEAKIQ